MEKNSLIRNLEKKHQCSVGCAEEIPASEHHLPWQKGFEERFEFGACVGEALSKH